MIVMVNLLINMVMVVVHGGVAILNIMMVIVIMMIKVMAMMRIMMRMKSPRDMVQLLE